MRKILLAALLCVATSAFAQYPQRPMQLIVPWGAGGGTDATARIIATLLEKELKQPFNVVNRTGGSGVVGHDAIAKAAPDGYTIGLITVEITMMHHVGLTPLKHTDYTPIGLVNADPAGINVRADSPYKSVKDLLAAIKANPGKFKASGTGQGGIWHLAIAGLLKDQGIDPSALPWVPSQRRGARHAGPGRRRRRRGAVLDSRGARDDRRRQGARARHHGRQSARALSERADAQEGARQQLADRRVARDRRAQGPSGRRCRRRSTTALKKVYDSKDYKDFMASRGFGVVWADPAGHRQVHGEVRRRPRRGAESGRAGQVG